MKILHLIKKYINHTRLLIALWTINALVIIMLGNLLFLAKTAFMKLNIPAFAQYDDVEIFTPVASDKTFRTGWIPYWDFSAGVTSFKENVDSFYSISPVLYEVNSDGTLKKRSPSQLSKLKEIARTNNVKIIPSIACFDWQTLSAILQDQKATQTHINQIVNEVTANNYDGIDIDYESTQLQDKYLYFRFLEDLSNQLHKKNKTLSVSIISQWDTTSYSALPQTREVQDLDYLPLYVDEIRVMTYDYTHQGSKEPGAIAPITWMEDVLKYMIIDKKVSPEKIWLGVHLYGYDWSSSPTREKASARTADYVRINNIKTEYNSEVAENIGSYNCQEFICTIYHQSKLGVQAREELAKKYGIKGVAFWRVGREDDLLK